MYGTYCLTQTHFLHCSILLILKMQNLLLFEAKPPADICGFRLPGIFWFSPLHRPAPPSATATASAGTCSPRTQTTWLVFLPSAARAASASLLSWGVALWPGRKAEGGRTDQKKMFQGTVLPSRGRKREKKPKPKPKPKGEIQDSRRWRYRQRQKADTWRQVNRTWVEAPVSQWIPFFASAGVLIGFLLLTTPRALDTITMLYLIWECIMFLDLGSSLLGQKL